MERDFVVSPQEAGKRLDVFLADKLKDAGYSRSFIQGLILKEAARVDNRLLKPHHKVIPGERVRLVIPDEKPTSLAAEDIALKIIFEDEHILVVDKPSGLVVHPGSGRPCGTLVNALLSHTPRLSSINPQRPGIVHRLDKDTSGAMVVAKTNPAHLKLARQFSQHTIKRKYIALVKGNVEFDQGRIDLPLSRHKQDFRRQAVSFTNSRYAVTAYQVLKRWGKATMLELTPETGRTHQLRVHLAYLGHPILGDSKYGAPGEGEVWGRLRLHARELGLSHPESGRFMSFVSELPPGFIPESLEFKGINGKKHLHL